MGFCEIAEGHHEELCKKNPVHCQGTTEYTCNTYCVGGLKFASVTSTNKLYYNNNTIMSQFHPGYLQLEKTVKWNRVRRSMADSKVSFVAIAFQCFI